MPDTKRRKSGEGRREGEEELGGHQASEGVGRAQSQSQAINPVWNGSGSDPGLAPVGPTRACVTASRDPFSRRRKVTLFRSAATGTVILKAI